MSVLHYLFHKKIYIKKDIRANIFKILCLPILQIRYRREEIQVRILGITLFKKKIIKHAFPITINNADFQQIALDNSVLLDELKKMDGFTYIPNPGNLGDILIAAATISFFKENHLNFSLYAEQKEGKNIVFGGGGGWAWLKAKPNGLERFFKLFKNAEKVIILPSSFYQCDKFIDLLDEKFTLFCREKSSFDYLKSKNLKSKVILDHDMAFRMSPNILKEQLFLSNYDLNILKEIQNKLNNINKAPKFLRQDDESINHSGTDLDLSRCMGLSENSSEKHILSWGKLMLCIVDTFDTIITDRLHVGVAALLMGKNIFWLDNSYKKVSGIYQQTLKNHPNIHFTNHIPNAISLSKIKKKSLDIIIENVEVLS